jgi:hypothetical protein
VVGDAEGNRRLALDALREALGAGARIGLVARAAEMGRAQ